MINQLAFDHKTGALATSLAKVRQVPLLMGVQEVYERDGAYLASRTLLDQKETYDLKDLGIIVAQNLHAKTVFKTIGNIAQAHDPAYIHDHLTYFRSKDPMGMEGYRYLPSQEEASRDISWLDPMKKEENLKTLKSLIKEGGLS